MKFEILKSVDHQFYFVFKAGNGEIVCTSEMYKSKQSCIKGIKSLKWCCFSKIIDKTK